MEKKQESANKVKLPFWKKLEHFAEQQPRRTFYMMFCMILFSVLFSIGNLIYVQKVSVPEYKKMKEDNILEDVTSSFDSTVEQTGEIMDMREALKELEYYRRKTVLSTSDSARIKYLLDKYHIKK
jgi:hypothetical protein